jgi:hypothetical protein
VLLVGIVEHRVALDTPRTPSQNDLWCMLATQQGQVSMAVEGKAGEDFDRRLGDWLGSGKESEGKKRRLKFLCDVLGISGEPAMHNRYQLFHRTASAILEAQRWRVGRAVMLVQSFSESKTSWQDYVDFAGLLGLSPARNAVAGPAIASGIELFLCWVDSPKASGEVAAAAV